MRPVGLQTSYLVPLIEKGAENQGPGGTRRREVKAVAAVLHPASSEP